MGRVSARIALCIELFILWSGSSLSLLWKRATKLKDLWLDSPKFALQSHSWVSLRNFFWRFSEWQRFKNLTFLELRRWFLTFMVRFSTLAKSLKLWRIKMFFIGVGLSRESTVVSTNALLLVRTVVKHIVWRSALKWPNHCHSRRFFSNYSKRLFYRHRRGCSIKKSRALRLERLYRSFIAVVKLQLGFHLHQVIRRDVLALSAHCFHRITSLIIRMRLLFS